MSKVFPKWSNRLPLLIVVFVFLVAGAVTSGITYYFTPKYTRVGYAPDQPVPFDHSLHAGQLGLDCRYCHTYVEKSAHSNIPTAETCLNCHTQIQTQSQLLNSVRESVKTGDPIPWVRIHQAPDYVYFDHSVHVNRGVSCVSCHGQVNEMQVVRHAESHSMAFCLNCHRAPENHIRPIEEVYNLDWSAGSQAEQVAQGLEKVENWNIKPPQSCSGCHR
ncbi:MAG: cytochrome C [Verrucomicrobia bacterium]|nr:MAG: cytochrome C [Verrucomicrobiota bacterium]